MDRVFARRELRRALRSAACLALLGSLAACSAEATTGPTERPSPSIGATPTPAPASEPDTSGVNPAKEPASAVPPAARDTERNRRAFAAYVVKAYQHGIRTNDAAPIMAVAAPQKEVRCVLCEGFAEESLELAQQNRYVPGLRITVDRVFFVDRLDHGVLEYYVDTHAGRATEMSRTGKPGKVYAADDSLVFDVGLRWHDGAYQLTGLKADV